METKMIENKVFCVGFQKTGTSSLRDALRLLGYKVAGVYGRGQDLASLQASYVEDGLRLAHEHDAVQDMPWPLIFRELDSAFPASKFILLEREAESWFGSIAGHFGDQPRRDAATDIWDRFRRAARQQGAVYGGVPEP